MPRAAAIFALVFADYVKSVGQGAVEALTADGKAELVRDFNAGYRAAWQYKGVAWEDSWEEGNVTVAAGLIDYAAVNDAHVFNFWTADPRTDSRVAWVDASTAKAGIYVGTDLTQVFGFWRPVCPTWDGADEELTMIALLTDAAQAFAQAEYYRRAGQYETFGARRKDAQVLCEDLAAVEFERLRSKWWLRRKE